jgi:MoaA/NifB/PqqE/SkfB family radical SAM enzyme
MNGSKIDEAMAARLVAEGPHEISISLNSHTDEVHSRTRGEKASFILAVAALRSLLVARTRLSARGSRIYAMALVCEQTYRDLDRFCDFVLNDIGADKLKLNSLQPTFGKAGLDPFFAANAIANYEELATILRTCDAKYNLGLSPIWIEQVKMYFRSVAQNQNAIQGWATGAGTHEHICNSYERNIMVDLYGTARLCFSHEFPGVKLDRVGDLRRFWYERRPDIRAAMQTCNRYCGISHSVRRENATVKPPRT